jgi:hypothetical protein
MAALWIVYVAVALFMLASMWSLFVKAGQPGWACIIPFYNVYTMLKIAGKPGWWLLLFFIPIVNIIVEIVMCIAIAEKFGKTGGFVAGMILLPFIFFPILGFGSAKYQG